MTPQPPSGPQRPVATILLAWILSLGFDLFLHGGLLAGFYVSPEGFLLGPVDAFRRIPFGYLAFLGYTAALYWLLLQLGRRGALVCFRISLLVGLVVHGATYVGLYSITTAAPSILLGWWLGQAFELALAGAVIGAMFDGRPTKAVAGKVTIAVVILVIGAVIMQSITGSPAIVL